MNKKYLPILFFVLFLVTVVAFTSNQSKTQYLTNVSDTTAPFVFKAKNHLGKSIITTSGAITFTTGLENDYYQIDSTNRIGHFYIEAKIAKFLNDNVKRMPLNISIVIDRSGSMQGIKMGYAKKAAKNIIDQLKPQDIVSIVVYDNDVDTIQGPIHVSEKEKIKSKIDLITPRASTNLWGGTDQGYFFVRRNFKPGLVNRVLLISDGLANVGLTDSTLIRLKVQRYKDDEGISLSTFGVGLDYNETLMADMAETGAGNYYFIDAPDKMTGIFNSELNGLLNVAAQNAELTINIPNGITILKSYPMRFQQKENEITVKLRDLSSEETKATLFTFKIDDKIAAALKFTSALNYTDVTDGQQKLLTNENILSPIRNADTYLTHFNKQVIEQTILFTANENLETAMSLIDRGDYASARNYLSQNSLYLKSNSGYVNAAGDLKKMDSLNMKYAQFNFVSRSISSDSLKRIQKTSKAANYNLRSKKQ